MDLPTKEQIAAIVDADALEGLADDIRHAIARMETDLEFSNRDDEWAHRAMGALTVHKIALGHVTKQIGKVRRQGASALDVVGVQTAKAEKAAAQAARAAELTKQQELLKQRQKIAAQVQAAELIKRTSWLHAFHQATVSTAPPELMERILEEAQRIHMRALRRELPRIKAS